MDRDENPDGSDRTVAASYDPEKPIDGPVREQLENRTRNRAVPSRIVIFAILSLLAFAGRR